MISISMEQLKDLLLEVYRQGAKQASENYKDSISQSKAWKKYGRTKIEDLLKRGLIHCEKGHSSNSVVSYSRSEIEAALQAEVSCRGYGGKGTIQAMEGMRQAS